MSAPITSRTSRAPHLRPTDMGQCLSAMVLLLIILLSPTVAAEETETVSIGIVSDNLPYSSMTGREGAGFSIDILKEVERHAGVTFALRAGSWPEIYTAFINGELDAIDGISFSEDRAKDILFTTPYHVRQTYLMHDRERPVGDIDSLEQLMPLRVGVVADIYYRDLLVENDINLNTYDSLPSLIRALAFGWVDVIFGAELTLNYYANLAGFRYLDVAGPAPLGTLAQEDFRIGVLKTNEALFQRLQQGLEAIPETRINELLERWQEFGGTRIAEPESFSLNTFDQHYVQQLGPIRVGIMQDYAPFSFDGSGRLQGLSVDILQRVGDLTGLQVIPVGGQWTELLELFRRGEIDVLADMSMNEERAEFTHFTEPYHIIPNVAFTLNNDLVFEDLDDLQGLSVGFGAGIYYAPTIREQLADNARPFASQRNLFRALADGTLDVALAALPNGNYWIRELGISGSRIAGELTVGTIPGEDLRFGVRPALVPLANIIDQALAAISPTEKRTIEDRWLGAAFNRPHEGTGDITLSDQERQWLQQRNEQLILCVDPDWMPLEGIDDRGRHIGLAAELFRLFADRSGIRFGVYPATDWQTAVEAARERRCDLFPLAMKTPQRARFMSFTEPYLHIPNVVIGRIEAPFIERLRELDGKRVGIVGDYAYAELLRQRPPGVELVEVDDEYEGLRLLQEGELDGYITTLATASHHMQELGLADLKVLGRIPADWALSVATRNDEPILLGIMQKLVASLSAEERKNLDGQWRSVQLPHEIDYSLVWQTLLGALAILALLFYWNRKLNRLNKELAQANATLAHLSVTDDLTQLGNRAYFDRELNHSFQWCQRHQAGFAVAMVDADHFKRVNDTYGHETGDICLKALAETMRAHFRRETDRIARFGGEEFVVFTTYTDEGDMIDRLNSFRRAVAETRGICSGQEVELTISIGLAIGIPGATTLSAEFLRRADQALYLAKQNGRNRLEVKTIAS
ncbi:transporter substrate-binding domain-containing protein [Marinobacter sp.]|uniref:transporter substrate-binding domain-containing diguanylate cyclase n=1 Tax=Marinobacter sp. TaxID=50741 RepID=UPI0034A54B9C